MSPAIGPDGTIYVGTSSGVAALDPTTGDPKWSYSLGGWACGPIIAHDGSLYVNAANKLRKFGAS
jgi:outer membrane protein assembly factor BamB